jgi:hypothetical protein
MLCQTAFDALATFPLPKAKLTYELCINSLHLRRFKDPRLISEPTNLTDWLSKVFAEGDAFDSGDVSTLPAAFFPTDKIREEYISTIDSRPEDEVRKLIRRMLEPPGAFADDFGYFELYVRMVLNPDESTLERDAKFWQSEHMQNVIAWFTDKSREPVTGNQMDT